MLFVDTRVLGLSFYSVFVMRVKFSETFSFRQTKNNQTVVLRKPLFWFGLDKVSEVDRVIHII